MASQYTDDLRLAHVLADDADSLTTARFKALDLHVMTKPDLTPVTDADTSVEDGIRRTLSRARPRDAVLGEESGATGHSQRRWVIDPIDGTKNFVRGVPVWATLIGLMVDGEVVVGVVTAPQLNRRWWATAGDGAWTGKSLLRAARCQVSDVSRLEDASLSYSSMGGWDERGRLDDFLSLARRCWRTRAYGDFWSYMLLAEGAVDIAAEPELELHDMAALEGGEPAAGLADDHVERGHVVELELGLGGDVDGALGEQHVGPEVAVGAGAPAAAGERHEVLEQAAVLPAGERRVGQRRVLEAAYVRHLAAGRLE